MSHGKPSTELIYMTRNSYRLVRRLCDCYVLCRVHILNEPGRACKEAAEIKVKSATDHQ